MVRMDKRLFAKGSNNNADVVIFKSKDAEIQPIDGYPYVGYIGTLLKKGPNKWTTISTRVVQDYQKACEDKFVEELRQKYPININESELQKVNNH